MHYVVELEISALLFLIVIAIRFFRMRLFPNKLNRLFGFILHCAIADLALDILGSYTIEYAAVVPPWINYVVNTVFYSLQVIFPALMMCYVLIMTKRWNGSKSRWAFVPASAFVLMLLINPFTDIIFYLQETGAGLVYTRGPMFITLYAGSMFYMLATVVLVLRNRERLQRTEFSTILIFIAIVVASMLLQFFFPSYLLTGVALALAILLMFFTMQNPENMLDMISGVFNYSALSDYLRRRIDEGGGMWLIAVDVGGIRRINSAFGLRAGNELIHQVGTFLNSAAKGDSWAFRMIGTRFLIVSDSAEAHQGCLERVQQRFSRPWVYSEMDITLIATVRYCTRQDFFQSPEDVINLVDLAYAEADKDGWGSSRAVDTELLSRSRRRLEVEGAIRQALDTDRGFSLNFQPLFSVKDKQYTSAEVLLRLDSPRLGSISPAEFIPVAERSGLIHQIDRLVISKSCEFLRLHPELERQGLRRLEVNLSAAEFYKDTAELERAITDRSAGKAGLLCFEVTETAATVHEGALSDFMSRMIAHGCSFALDDFGTGYANLTQLLSLPFSIVKLDRSLLISQNERDSILFGDLLSMFARIGLSTVVEGVENWEQSQRASEMGADFIQGFYYSRPLTEEGFLSFFTC